MKRNQVCISPSLREVVNTVSCLAEVGNPFIEESENLMAIHAKDIMDDSVVATVKNAHKIGRTILSICQRKIH